MIVFGCTICRKEIRISAAAAGRAGKCPHCKNPITVPSLGRAEPDKVPQRQGAPLASHPQEEIQDVIPVRPQDIQTASEVVSASPLFGPPKQGPPKTSRAKLILIAGLGLGGVLLFAVLGIVLLGFALRGPTRESQIGEEIRFGDLGVTIMRARVEGFTSTTASGRSLVHQPDFVVTIAFKNYNPNRVISAGSQVLVATLKDDVGNSYNGISAKNEIGLTNQIDGQISPGMARPVRSDGRSGDVLVFGRPVAGASAVLLTLDASKYGGTGWIKVRIPRSAWAE